MIPKENTSQPLSHGLQEATDSVLPNEITTQALSPGLQEVFDTVTKVQEKVLTPLPATYLNLAKPMADHAAAMMVQDMTTFLHGTEQILLAAIARASALLLVQSTQNTGKTALTELKDIMVALPVFATNIGTAASGISNNFGNKSAAK